MALSVSEYLRTRGVSTNPSEDERKGGEGPSTSTGDAELDEILTRRGSTGLGPVVAAIHQQESRGGKVDTSKPNYGGARGPMQVIESTFKQMQAEGRIPANYRWDNPRHSKEAGVAYVEYLAERFGADPEKIAQGYYGGPGAVGKRDRGDPRNANAPTVGQYGDSIVARMGASVAAPTAPAARGSGGMSPWQYLEQQRNAPAAAAEPPAQPELTPEQPAQPVAGPVSMTWDQVMRTPDYLKSDDSQREQMREAYWNEVVAPQIPADQQPAARAAFDADTNPTLSQRAVGMAKLAGGAIVHGTGSALSGIGTAMQEGGQLLADGIEAAGGPPIDAINPLSWAADPIKQAGDEIRNSRPLAQQVGMEQSMPQGNLFDPSTWSAGEDPSIEGYVQQGVNIVGEMAPILAGIFLTRGRGGQAMVGAGLGGAQGGDFAADQARQTIEGMTEAELTQQSSYYRQLRDRLGHEQAKNLTAQEAAKWAFRFTAPVSALGGAATAAILSPAARIGAGLVGSNVAGNMALRGGLEALEEGTQEVAENMATEAGINRGAGTQRDITRDSFPNFVLGALGGAGPGAVAGGMAARAERDRVAAPAGGAAPVNPEPSPNPPAGGSSPTGAPGPSSVPPDSPAPSAGGRPRRKRGAGQTSPEGPLPASDVLGPVMTEGPAPADTAAPAEPEKQPWEQTRQEFADDAAYQGVNAATDESSPSYWFTDQSEEARQFAEGERGDGTAPKRVEPRIDIASKRKLGAEWKSSDRPSGSKHAYTGERKHRPIVASIPLDAASDPHRYLVEKALQEGQPVPQQVLAEYPDLAAKYGKQPSAPAPANAEDQAPASAGLPVFTGKTSLGNGKYGAKIGSLSEGNHRQLMVAPDGSYYWGEYYEAAKRDVGVVPDGPDKDGTPALFETSAEARKAAEATPQDRGKPAAAPSAPAPASAANQAASSAPADPRRAAVQAIYDAHNDDVNSSIGDLADKLDEAEDLPPEIRRAVDDYRDAVQTDYDEWGGRGDWDEFEGAFTGAIESYLSKPTPQPNTSPPQEAAPEQKNETPAPAQPAATIETPIDAAAHEAATSPTNDLPEPTDAQKEAGVYKKGHVRALGLDISIENPKGSERKGTGKNGKPWRVVMPGHYGYIKGTVGKDKDHIDVTLGPDPENAALPVFVVNQVDLATGRFDEHKSFLGYADAEAARQAYRDSFSGKLGQKMLNNALGVVKYTPEQFKQWLAEGNHQKPAQAPAGSETEPPMAKLLRERRENARAKLEQMTSSEDFYASLPRDRAKFAEWWAPDMRWGGSGEHHTSEALADFSKAVEDLVMKSRGPQFVIEHRKDAPSYFDDPLGYLEHWMGRVAAEATDEWVDQGVEPTTEPPRQPAQRKPAEVIDNTATNPGEYLVRGDGTNLARFTIGAKGQATKVKFFFDSQQTRDYAQAAIDKFVAEQQPAPAAKPDKAKLVPRRTTDGGVKWAAEPAETPAVSANTIFTDDAYAKALAVAKAKLGQVNSGVDPELMQAGLTIAGYHIEKGARTFAAYAKAVVEALGDVAKPYLKQWYMAITYDPRMTKELRAEMTPVAEVDSADVEALLTPAPGAMDTAPAQEQTRADGDAAATEPVPDRGSRGDREDAAVGDGDREPLDAGLAAGGEVAAGGRGVSGSPDRAGAEGAGSVQPAGERAPGSPRNSGSVRPESGTAEPRVDHDLADQEIGTGGLQAKYRDNVAAIRILRAMAAENRPATPEERLKIARYVGWGALKGVFDPNSKTWAKQHAELKGLLTEDEWKAARASTLNAHFTSKPVVNAIFRGLDRLGFKGGRVLEPSVGVGNFFGLMPAGMRSASQLHGVELDPLTAKIAAALYPSAKITQAGFQDFEVPSGFFDVAIGNPPFGSEAIVDSARSPYSGFSIHNYFFAKSLDKLRPGGLLAMVVSHSFLDSKSDVARQWIAKHARLVAGVRLPNTAFKENAGTEVVTDILVFQKTDAPDASPDWLTPIEQTLVNPKTGENVKAMVSRYFAEHPERVLGTPSAAGKMYRQGEYTVEPAEDWQAKLEAWADGLPELYAPIDRSADMQRPGYAVPDGVKVGSFFVAGDGSVKQRGADALGERTAIDWTPPNGKALERMKGMVELRDLLREQMRLERSPDATEKQIEANRKRLSGRYDAFQKKNGYLNSPTNRRVFLDDTEAPLLLALEFDYDRGISKAVSEREGVPERAPSAVKADILKRRVLFPPSDNLKVTTAQDALLASLNYRGRVDADYMAGVYGKSAEDIETELGDAVYRDPQAGLVTSDEYLSGDVKTKLAEAEAAAKDDPAYRRNVEALQKVIPADKRPSEIHAQLGANFIPPEVYQAFAKHVTGSDYAAQYVAATGTWVFAINSPADTALNTSTYGIPLMTAQDIFERTMRGQGVVVKRTVRHSDGSTETFVMEQETELAREKQNAMKAEWQSWLWGDAERAERIASIYNEKMNRLVPRKFDGSHLTFPGMSPAVTLLAHQKNGVWRGLQSRRVLYDHVVGAGKTFQMATLAMEMRRLGIARKPLFAVPNHLTLQWRQEFYKLYPSAYILVAEPDDFAKGSRERFFSKIATGDWDAVIVGHSSLKKIPLPAQTERQILEEQIGEIAAAVEELKQARGDRNIIRDMEKIKKNLEAKMQAKVNALGNRDKVLSFDELGLDALFVDEMHEFKNLFYNTTMERTAGMGNPAGSDKAFDLFVKIRWLVDLLGAKAPLVTATGTPVSNSLVEMFNMQRYMQYPELKADGLHVFDAWAHQFAHVSSVYEVAPSGTGYRQSTRLGPFANLPALMARYGSFADTITLDDLKAQEEARGKRFPVPKLATGRPINVVAERSPRVANFMGVPRLQRAEDGSVTFAFDPAKEEHRVVQNQQGKWTAEVKRGDYWFQLGTFETEEDARAGLVQKALSPVIGVDPGSILGQFENLKQLTKSTKGRINALSLTGLANKAGLDYRLIDPSAPDFPDSKINLAVERMVELYHKWSADKGAQLVFCDLSVPLSARAHLAAKDRLAYVRAPDGLLTHVRATLHTVAGFEHVPYLLVATGKGASKAVTVYDAASGQRVRSEPFRTKAEAIAWAEDILGKEANRERWLEARIRAGEIGQDDIDDYNNTNEINPDETPTITREDIGGSSGSQAFSVYDDIKAKLVARGVPEREVAFIHDYDTPTAKAKLFAAVNAGRVRFLLGSTPKMGAGTNVQERLVGLHHIDAPWRPSDLEQREGRIIRRGNKLYERDPDGFEIGVYRYATSQTYDTRRWQILEHKARVIEQMRKYDGSFNEIEDIEGEASNAADMKAAASGDPLILEETRLKNEVKRLENVQAAHADAQMEAVREASRYERQANEVLPKRVAELDKLIAVTAKHPIPEDKEKFVGLAIDGYGTYTDKAKAIDGIKDMVAALIKEQANDTSGVKSRVLSAAVTYRGLEFEFTLRRSGSSRLLAINSPLGLMSDYALDRDPFSPSGALTRLNNFVERLRSERDFDQASIATYKEKAAALREAAKDPFKQGAELAEARAQYRRVQLALMAKGPAVPADEKPLLEKALQEQRDALRKAGLGQSLDELLGMQRAADGGEKAYSRRGQPVLDALQAAIDSSSPNPVVLGDTPQALVDIGLPALPLTMKPTVVRKIHGVHGISITDIARVPALLADPVMVFKSDTVPDAVVVLTKAVSPEGSIVVTVMPNGEVARIESNVVTSAYGKNKPSVIAKWVEGGRLIAAEKKNARMWLSTQRLQLPPVVQALTRARTIKVRPEDDLGKPGGVLFSHRSAHGFSKPATAKQIREWIGEEPLAGVVRIVKDVEALRRATGDPNILPDAEGLYRIGDDKAYIVASMVPDQATAQRLYRHEVMGHLAVELYGDVQSAVGDVLGSKHASIAPLIAEVNRMQPGLSRGMLGREVIALVAERGIEHPVIARLIGRVRALLRKLGVKLEFSEDDIRALIARSARAASKDAARQAARTGYGTPAEHTASRRNAYRRGGAAAPASLDHTGLIDAAFKHLGGKQFARLITSPLYDRLIRAGGRLVPEKLKQGFIADYGLPEPYLDAKIDKQAAVNRVLRKTRNLVEMLAGLDREQSRIAYLWMNEKPDTDLEAQLLAMLPEDSRAVVTRMKDLVDELGREAVNVGLLTPESYERNKMAYLHRTYRVHMTANGESVQARHKKNASIRAANYKGRGLRDDVDPTTLGDFEVGDMRLRIELRGPRGGLREVRYIPTDEAVPEGWTVDGEWEIRWEGQKPGVGAVVGMWRDLTADERQRLGEVEEVRFAFAKTMLNAIHDIENQKFLAWVGEQYGVEPSDDLDMVEASDGFLALKTYGPDQYVKVPSTGIPKTPGLKKYGKLAGKVIPAVMWNDIRNTMALPESDLSRFYDRIMRAWKISKALALDTPIPTPTGWTTMGDLKPGDLVFDERGQPAEVLQATETQHDHECYRVEFSDGTSIVADAGHLWYTEFHGRPGIRETRDIAATLKERTRGDNNHRIPVAGAFDLPDADLPIHPYVLGLWLGDGHSSGARVTTGADDADEVMGYVAGAGYEIGAIRRDPRSNAIDFHVRTPGVNGKLDGKRRHEAVQAKLRALGLLGNKHVPAAYLRASEAQRRELLMGLMDSDGHITDRGLCGFCATDSAIKDGALELLRSLGYKPTAVLYETRCNGKAAAPAWKINFKAYADRPVFKLARKVARLCPPPATRQRSQTRQIVAVTQVPSVPVRCILVSSPSHLFLAGEGMVPTHNTALSPTVHVNNVMSNFILADIAEVRARDVARALRTIVDAKQGDEAAKELIARYEDSGAEQGSFHAMEIQQDIIKPLLRELEQTEDEGLLGDLSMANIVALLKAGDFRNAGKALGQKAGIRQTLGAGRRMIDLYRNEDGVFRLAKFMRELDAGRNDRDAGKAARDAFLNYEINAPLVQAARRTALPFIAFSYRAIPKMLETAAHKPWKLAKYFTAGAALNALAYSMLGMGDDDEDRERALLPEELQGRVLGVFPRLVRMPWNDANGAPTFLDVRRWVPAGDVMDTYGSHSTVPLPNWLSVGGPLAFALEAYANKSMFTGEPIVKDSDTAAQKAAKFADYAFKWAAPNLPLPNPLNFVLPAGRDGDEPRIIDLGILPGVDRDQLQTYSWTGVMRAGTGREDAFGRESGSVGQALASSIGIKARSYPIDVAKKRVIGELNHMNTEIDRNIRQLAKERARGGLTEAEYRERLNTEVQKKRDLYAEAAAKLGAGG